MVSNAPVSERHCLALPADVKSAHWSGLRETRGGAYAKSKLGSRIHIQVQKIHSLRGEIGLSRRRIVCWVLGGGAGCVQEGNLWALQQGEFLAGPLPAGSRGGGGLFAVQCDPDYSGADFPLHGFPGFVPLLLFKSFLTFGDVAAPRIANSGKNGKRIKIILPHANNCHTLSDQRKGANCVVKTESGAL